MGRLSDVVLEHFEHPRCGKPLSPPFLEGQVGSRGTPRYMGICVRVESNAVHAASFQAYGCACAIAAGSLLCEWALGRSVPEVRQLSATALEAMLGGLPATRRYCADLAIEAMREALRGYA